ncbi:hypothetical protein WN55_07371 [Dufourea novaeangliae]|uniref:Uncharacterized protein n=1 Tax=Dufourea novaeangliae TaxID=178035 RepID=A0A154PSA0_DUFNO|nr:hypothetical protein WN55_07371 [Dufourea novaeangliae]
MAVKNNDIVLQINELNIELKKKLEVVSKWRVECAELQLEFLKLYTPQMIEILESLKELENTNIDSNNESLVQRS